jgi:hypothetical protein
MIGEIIQFKPQIKQGGGTYTYISGLPCVTLQKLQLQLLTFAHPL